MRSLNLLFGKRVKHSTFQIIWEIWFTVSIIAFLIVSMIAIYRSEWISEGILYIIGLHAVASTVVGLTTTEKEQLYGDYGYTAKECIEMRSYIELTTPQREALMHYDMVNNIES